MGLDHKDILVILSSKFMEKTKCSHPSLSYSRSSSLYNFSLNVTLIAPVIARVAYIESILGCLWTSHCEVCHTWHHNNLDEVSKMPHKLKGEAS